MVHADRINCLYFILALGISLLNWRLSSYHHEDLNSSVGPPNDAVVKIAQSARSIITPSPPAPSTSSHLPATISTTTKTKKVAIVTINTGIGSAAYERAMANQRVYASAHGYDWFNANTLLKPYQRTVHTFMQKAFALQAVLARNYQYVMWIDRDAIFVDEKIALETRLQQLHQQGGDVPSRGQYDLYVAVEPWAWLNTGVLIFRNTDFSRRLVADWIETYQSRKGFYDSSEKVLIQGTPTMFRDLFGPQWSCEDQGALIALLAGFDASSGAQKWNIDKYDGLGKPHLMHQGHDAWADRSSGTILAQKYRKHIKVVAQSWFNTNPWDCAKPGNLRSRAVVVNPYIFHFNGQKNKPRLIEQYTGSKKRAIAACSL